MSQLDRIESTLIKIDRDIDGIYKMLNDITYKIEAIQEKIK